MKRKRKQPKPVAHQFGKFNVRRVRVTTWRIPPNRDEDCEWTGDFVDCRKKRKR